MSFNDLLTSKKKKSKKSKKSNIQSKKYDTNISNTESNIQNNENMIQYEKYDTFEIEGKILDLEERINEIQKNSIHNTDFTPKEYFSIIDDELSEVGTDISKFKDEIDFLKGDMEDIVKKFEKSKSKMSYAEFKQFILDNRTKGTHYSSYCKQLKYKESDIKNFYLIYLDLP